MKCALLIVILSLFCSCNQNKKTIVEVTERMPKSKFAKLISSTIECNNAGNIKCPVAILFYKNNHGAFLQTVEYPGVLLENLKGYCELNNYLLLYYGVNDSLSQVYMDIQKVDSNYLTSNYSILDGWDIDLPEKNISFYEILNDTIFRKRLPTDAFMNSFLKQLMVNGIKKTPPPLPVE